VLAKNVNLRYTKLILPLVLCGCEAWSVTLREECRPMISGNRVLRGIFWPKRDEIMGLEETA
jgi:hypothetical protein